MRRETKILLAISYMVITFLILFNTFQNEQFIQVDYKIKSKPIELTFANFGDSKFQDSVETYLSESAKQSMFFIGAKSVYEKYVLNKEFVRDKAVFGDEMLFLKKEIQFFEENTANVNEINAYAEKLNYIYRYYQSNDIEFKFVIAPNKSKVYPERLPDVYKFSQLNTTNLFIDSINEINANMYIPLFDYVIKYADNSVEDTYFLYDAHWNFKMGYIAGKYLLDELSIENEVGDYSEDLVRKEVGIGYSEIARLSGTYGLFYKDMSNFMLNRELIVNPSVAFVSLNGEDENRIAFIRDSFFNQVIPFYSEQKFGQEHIWLAKLKSDEYDDLLSLTNSSEIVVFESVERNMFEMIETLYGIVSTTSNNYEEVGKEILDDYTKLEGFNANISAASKIDGHSIKLVGWGKVPNIDSYNYETVVFLYNEKKCYKFEGENRYESDVTEYFDDGTNYDNCRFSREYTNELEYGDYKVVIGINVNGDKYLVDPEVVISYANEE